MRFLEAGLEARRARRGMVLRLVLKLVLRLVLRLILGLISGISQYISVYLSIISTHGRINRIFIIIHQISLKVDPASVPV